MASFSAKRKPRAIRVFGDDQDDQDDAPNSSSSDATATEPSALRKSIAAQDNVANDASVATPPGATLEPSTVDGDDGPLVVRPALSRAGSTKSRKKRLSSRLSFGGDAAEADDDTGAFATPKKATLSAKALENSSALRSRLPVGSRSLGGSDAEQRPRYSKELLDELASSTPNTPREVSSTHDAEIMGFDAAAELDLAELEGAVIVNEPGLLARHRPSTTPTILTETQIRERKERRARLAAEQEFISLAASDDEGASEYMSLGTKKKKKEKESRLVREDEDLGEGFDEYVEDGGLSLGRRAEREAARKKRAEMAELIDLAEDGASADGNGADDDEDDSEAERRAAYEDAQTRAGMDGLPQHRKRELEEAAAAAGGDAPEIPRMKPLPDLAESLARLQVALQAMEADVAAKRALVAELRADRDDITTREAEVQAILDKAGKQYQAVSGTGGTSVSSADALTAAASAAQSPAPAERGLESFGAATPSKMEVDELG